MAQGNKLAGQWALVTGGSRGIGLSIAQALASEGASLILVSRSADQLAEAAKQLESGGAPKCETYPTDLGDERALQSVAEQVLSKHGHIDILVNNAGIFSPGSALDGDPDGWAKQTAVNLLGPMRLTRALAPKMAERQRGVIINIGSTLGYDALPFASAYCASKFGLRGWSLSTYEAMRVHGVKTVLISPAWTDTDINKEAVTENRDLMIQPSDVGQAVLFVINSSMSCCPSEILLRNTKPIPNAPGS